MVNDLELAAALVARPPLEAAGVGGIGPHPLEARQSRRRGLCEEELTAEAVLEIGTVNAGAAGMVHPPRGGSGARPCQHA